MTGGRVSASLGRGRNSLSVTAAGTDATHLGGPERHPCRNVPGPERVDAAIDPTRGSLLSGGMQITTARPILRPAREADFPRIASALRDWWRQPGFDTEIATRERVAMVPRLWLQHFASTSLIAEMPTDPGGQLYGFLVGFVSADRPDEGYIHFVGVWPGARRMGVGRLMYEAFFELCRARGCSKIRCVASPPNMLSVNFHAGMGFTLEPGPATTYDDGPERPYMPDYDGPGIPRIRFVRAL